MKALLVVAHGSRRVESNDEIRALAAALETQAKGRYDFVNAAFLELAEPSIPDGIEACIQRGATEVVVMPYFLSAGRHVVTDVPSLVLEKQQQHADISIRFAPYLGASPAMTDFIFQTLDSGNCLCGQQHQPCAYPRCMQSS